jgi:hypothetical protein
VSRFAPIEVPGMYHLVQQRVRAGRPGLTQFHDRLLTLAALHGSVFRSGMQLCGYNVLSDRVLLVVIPTRPRATGLARFNLNPTFLGRFDEIHRGVAPYWERRHESCPFADEAAWSVLRYVDIGPVRHKHVRAADPHALNSAAEHAGLLVRGLLTAPREKLPRPQAWQAFIESEEDRRFVQVLEQCLRAGRPFGPLSFIRQVEQACGHRLSSPCADWPGLFGVRR